MTRLATEEEIEALLKRYRIPHVNEVCAKDLPRLLNASRKLPTPWVLKIISRDATHKTDKGLVKLNIHNENELKKAFATIQKKAKGIRIEGYVIQEQKNGVEFIVGGKVDPVFGNVLVFGLGGLFVELIKERSLRILPIDEKEVRTMLRETKASAFFTGYRNQWVSEDALAAFVMKAAHMLYHEERIMELDFNPVIAREREILVADARIVWND
ncbi:acetate--CoA ligase family protein [Candidatus Micrarchaeota archaeon]|nr:acetate--CoA ligase family protein [Candidatus Micrarchaeota archaeon]